MDPQSDTGDATLNNNYDPSITKSADYKRIHTRAVEIAPELEPLTWMFWRKRRYIVVMMAFFGFFNVFTLRVNLSVGIVAMTENRTVYYDNGTVGYEQDFDWSPTEQGLVLSSFFYGYILTQFVGGYYGSRLGGNWVFGGGVFATALLTLLTPLAANAGIGVLIAVRVIEGICEGVTFPCIHAVWARWAPPNERTRMANTAMVGNFAGTVVGMTLSGVLASAFGWESVFYVFGVIGCIWFVAWVIIVREGPEQDRYISEDELRYILETSPKQNKKTLAYPWKAIFTSSAVYAICVSQFAETWGMFTLLTQLPTFLKDTLQYNLADAGVLAATPYMALGLSLLFTGYLADFCQVKGWLTTTQVRRYFNCGGFFGQTVFMMVAAYVLHPIGSIVALTVAVALGAFAMCGFLVNHLDLAPQYASVLMGITNTVATIPGIISPTLTGIIVQNRTADEWRIVFYIASGIYSFGAVIYWFFVSGELQPWAKVMTSDLNGVDQITNEKKPKEGYVKEAATINE